jgi:uncharacterized repeat protein (TIGR01451 family)
MNTRSKRLLAATIVLAMLGGLTAVASAANIQFTQQTDVFLEGGYLEDTVLASADFNKDGREDLVAIHRGDNDSETVPTLSISLSNGSGTYDSQVQYDIGYWTDMHHRICIADLNGDGDLDIAVTVHNDYSTPKGRIDYLLGNGDGTFAAKQIRTTQDYPWDIQAADFNHDGHMDLAVYLRSTSNCVVVHYGLVDGSTFSGFSAAVSALAATVNYPKDLTIGDFNNDTWPDLAVSTESASIYVMLNSQSTGQASFTSSTSLPISATDAFAPGGEIVCGDFNSDGNDDLAIAGSAVYVKLGLGTGSFNSSVQYGPAINPSQPSGSCFECLVTDDFNLDGIADLVALSRYDTAYGTTHDDLYLFHGVGNGTFTNMQSLNIAAGVYASPGRMIVAQLNNDSSPDLAMKYNFGNNIQRFFNTTPTVESAPTVTTTTAGTCTFDFDTSRYSTATGGNVTSDGGSTVTARGVCYGTTANPTIASSTAPAATGGAGSFSVTLQDLVSSTRYYYRAYATNAIGTSYGAEYELITPAYVLSNPESVVTETAARMSGDVWSGNVNISAKGFIYSATATTRAELITSGTMITHENAISTGAYYIDVTGLTSNETYYYIAYATNPAGTTYSLEVQTFRTKTITTTNPATSISQTSATLNGNVETGGGELLFERGFYYSDTYDTFADLWAHGSIIKDGGVYSAGIPVSDLSTGNFSKTLTTLSPNTTYFFMAYSINITPAPIASQPSYGAILSFTTPSAPSPAPTVNAIDPAQGPIAGGTAVTITGTNFVDGCAVTIGGVSATSVSFSSATTLTAVTPAHAAGAVDVVVTNPDTQTGNLTSGFTYVAPNGSAPVITTHPEDQSVESGQTATFTAAASGEPEPSVQWQYSTNGGKKWLNIAGATSPSYDTDPVTAAMNGYQYRAVFTNAYGKATSNSAVLTVSDIQTDVVITQSGIYNAAAKTITWTISLTNTGPASAENVVIRDTLANTTKLGAVTTSFPCKTRGRTVIVEVGTLDIGESTEIVIIEALVTRIITSVVNTATVETTSPDIDLTNNTCIETVEIT